MDFFYKKDQAKYYRLAFGVVIFLLGLFGAWRWFKYWSGALIAGKTYLPVDWIGVVVVVVLAAFLALKFAGHHEKTVDYIIDTDEEMRKVTWPTKDELKANSIVVVVVMVILGAITSVLDFAFIHVFELLDSF